MVNDIVLTQTKKVVMTMDKTVTVVTEKLETVDKYGRRKLQNYERTESVENHDLGLDLWRAA